MKSKITTLPLGETKTKSWRWGYFWFFTFLWTIKLLKCTRKKKNKGLMLGAWWYFHACFCFVIVATFLGCLGKCIYFLLFFWSNCKRVFLMCQLFYPVHVIQAARAMSVSSWKSPIIVSSDMSLCPLPQGGVCVGGQRTKDCQWWVFLFLLFSLLQLQHICWSFLFMSVSFSFFSRFLL